MAGFTTRAYGSAHYTQTTGMLLFSVTTGAGPYQLNDPQPGFVTARDKIPDGSKLRYRATSGIKQEIGEGVFDYANNRLIRGFLDIPNSGLPVDWDVGRKLIYILKVGA
jgi:hypothetical protein